MRSFFLFICCFLSIGGGIFLGFQGMKAPQISSLEASPTEIKATWIAAVKTAYQAGDIISKKDILWLEGHLDESDALFLSRAAFEAEQSSFLVTNIALMDGNLLEDAQVIWPTDENYIRTALKPDHVAITLPADAFNVMKPEDHPAGSALDIYLEQVTNKPTSRKISNSFPLLIASSVRILKWNEDNGNKVRTQPSVVTLEVSDSQLKAVMLARKSGSLVAIAAAKAAPVHKIEPSFKAISILRAAFAPSPTAAVQTGPRQILLQRGGKRETVSLSLAPSLLRNGIQKGALQGAKR